jgi:phosphoglycerate dehydrogenase-like enzyme
MKQRTLIITQDIDASFIHTIKAMIPDWSVYIGKDKSIWQDYIQDAEIVAGWRNEFEDVLLKKDTLLRWVQAWSADVNGMGLDRFEENQIYLTSANGVHAYCISETIFAFMLALTRQIHIYVRNQQQKKWHHGGLRLEIHEKTIGLIGVGAIGKETAKIAKAFGMTVLGMRHSGQPEEYVDRMFKPNELEQLLPQCDYVVNTLPLTPDTYHFFGQHQFKLLKPTSFFVNIGRGHTVDESAMIRALQEKWIAGAGLDVFEIEPLAQDNPLWEMENVIISPHTAGANEHYDKRLIQDIFIPNLKHYISHGIPSFNVVDYIKGY